MEVIDSFDRTPESIYFMLSMQGVARIGDHLYRKHPNQQIRVGDEVAFFGNQRPLAALTVVRAGADVVSGEKKMKLMRLDH